MKKGFAFTKKMFRVSDGRISLFNVMGKTFLTGLMNERIFRFEVGTSRKENI